MLDSVRQTIEDYQASRYEGWIPGMSFRPPQSTDHIMYVRPSPKIEQWLASEADNMSRLQYWPPYRILRETEESVREQYNGLQVKPILASAPNGSFSAFCFVQEGEYAIIFDERLLEFAHCIAMPTFNLWKLASQDFGERADEFQYDLIKIATCIDKRISEDEEILFAYLEPHFALQSPEHWKSYTANRKFYLEANLGFPQMIRQSFLIWTMAHEYSHITCGHLEDAGRQDFGSGAAQQLHYSRDMEFEADLFAIRVAHQCVFLASAEQGDRLNAMVFSAMISELFLNSLGLQGLIERIWTPGDRYLRDSLKSSHPRLEERRKLMGASLNARLVGSPEVVGLLRYWCIALYSLIARKLELALSSGGIVEFAQIGDLETQSDEIRTAFTSRLSELWANRLKGS